VLHNASLSTYSSCARGVRRRPWSRVGQKMDGWMDGWAAWLGGPKRPANGSLNFDGRFVSSVSIDRSNEKRWRFLWKGLDDDYEDARGGSHLQL
jgi:hypothetical protein